MTALLAIVALVALTCVSMATTAFVLVAYLATTLERPGRSVGGVS